MSKCPKPEGSQQTLRVFGCRAFQFVLQCQPCQTKHLQSTCQESNDVGSRNSSVGNSAAPLRGIARATRVMAFGSLTRTGVFDARSDIDLAEEGIPVSKFWRASADAAAVVGQFELDVVDLGDCQPALRDIILREGVSL